MVHDPCGNPACMHENMRTKRFFEELLKETQTGHDGAPLYRRMKPVDGGATTTITVKVQSISYYTRMDKWWKMLHSLLLSCAFNEHINIELCKSIQGIKKVCKYVK